MKNIKNTAVLAAISSNNKQGTINFTVLTLAQNSSFELPYCEIDGEKDMRAQLSETFNGSIMVDGHGPVSPEQLEACGSYSVENENYLEIVNAYMTFLDGEPRIDRKNGEKVPLWMNIDGLEGQPLYGNHNEILKGIKEQLLQAAMVPSGNNGDGEGTKSAIISKFFPENKEIKHAWVERIQKSGRKLNVYEHMHPGVAIDLVVIGYKKSDDSINGKDEICILLTKRKKEDSLNNSDKDMWEGWSLPGTFLRSKEDCEKSGVFGLETIQQAAARVATEKTGIIIQPDDILYNVRPFIHHSRMNWRWRDGSPVITLPVVLPIKYCDLISKETLTTSESKWFPIKRMLWTVNEEVEGGLKKIALRGDKEAQTINEDGTISDVKPDEDDNTSIYRWEDALCDFRTNYDWENIRGTKGEQTCPDNLKNILRSPDEIGLHAADVYIKDDKLVIDYYHRITTPHRPIQDWNYDDEDKRPALPQGTELLIADHANIIIRALQEISSNADLTLHIVCKLLKGGVFKPIEVTKIMDLFFFPWSFSQSTMHKKLTRVTEEDDKKKNAKKKKKIVNKNLLVKVPQNKQRENTYQFVDEKELENILLNSKPF